MCRMTKITLVFGLLTENKSALSAGFYLRPLWGISKKNHYIDKGNLDNSEKAQKFGQQPPTLPSSMKLQWSLTNFSVQGKSKSLTSPKSSPETMFRPVWLTQAQLTSALSAFRGQMPMTSSPRMLLQKRKEKRRKPLGWRGMTLPPPPATISRQWAVLASWPRTMESLPPAKPNLIGDKLSSPVLGKGRKFLVTLTFELGTAQ